MAQIGQGIAPSRPQARVAHMARRGLCLRFVAWTQGSWWVELVGWHWAAARACGVLSCGHVNVGSASGPGVLAAHAASCNRLGTKVCFTAREVQAWTENSGLGMPLKRDLSAGLNEEQTSGARSGQRSSLAQSRCSKDWRIGSLHKPSQILCQAGATETLSFERSLWRSFRLRLDMPPSSAMPSCSAMTSTSHLQDARRTLHV